MKIVFMGTPDFAVAPLQSLAQHHEILCVYTQPPRPAGRGKRDRISPVHQAAMDLGLPVRHPASLRSEDVQHDLAALQPDVAVVVAYGLILPRAILSVPRHGCLNIHASLLPRWRGAAPIHRAIMAGDAQTGVAIMAMEEGLDTGPVLRSETVTIGPEDTTADLHDRLSTLGARLICSVLRDWPLDATPQPSDGITYAHKIDKTEARIDWTGDAIAIDRQIRGLSPFPGAWTTCRGERIKLLRSCLATTTQPADPGQISDGLVVACGAGAVRITLAQREGKRPMDAEDLLRGWDQPERFV